MKCLDCQVSFVCLVGVVVNNLIENSLLDFNCSRVLNDLFRNIE